MSETDYFALARQVVNHYMSSRRKTKIGLMSEILEDFGSGQVMTNVSPKQVKRASELVDTFPIDKAIRDAAIAAVDGLEISMRAENMNPADYSEIRDLPEKVLTRMKKALDEEAEYFLDVFKDHLANRG